jgi:U32 family peptidase
MKRTVELLAPGGDTDSIKAAIAAGADAVYCGLNRFNARNRATNINFEDLNGIIHLAHGNSCQVFLTLNIIILGSEIPALISLLNKLVNTRIDGVIVQDLGVFYLLSKYFKNLNIHASTQLNTHNESQIHFLSQLTATRVNLSRELNINEIKTLTRVGKKHNILTEVFVHGSYCISFSGICYMSSVLGGKSGNRGRCSQPCRDRYLTTPEGKNFPLNLKDNSAYLDLREISDAGVASIKIEGRIKKFDYVYTVVNSWKKQIWSLNHQNRLNSDNSDLYRVFNRAFSNSYLKGDIHKSMFIDNPRDHSIKHLFEIDQSSTNSKWPKSRIALYEEKEEIAKRVKSKIKHLSIAKVPLVIHISGKLDRCLKVSVKTPGTSFVVCSETNLVKASEHTQNRQRRNQSGEPNAIPPDSNHIAKKIKKNSADCLNYKVIFERLKALNETDYYIKHMELENLQSDLFISFKELTSIKRKIFSILNESIEFIDPIDVPFFKKPIPLDGKPNLAVLISSKKDVSCCTKTLADIFFQLPNCLDDGYSDYVDLFLKNDRLIPWFPSVLIGENHRAAIDFLQQVKPRLIVTNNTGIAHEACKIGIPWIAGPYLNMVNSFSLLCVKENFNCSGAFISNEINKNQIKNIICPENFKLYYRIYHPILLLTSRQCLLHQVTGCEKNRIDEECMRQCNRSSSITNETHVSLFIDKTKGNYHCIYNDKNFLNTDITDDLPDMFSGFCIDLRDITTETTIKTDKLEIIALFENLLNGNPGSKTKLNQMIHPTTMAQYRNGI